LASVQQFRIAVASQRNELVEKELLWLIWRPLATSGTIE
jgi:hypothetical protein